MTSRGLFHVYTGEGKGKTTAALGLALRASGHGLRVLFLQFLKGRNTGEVRAAEHIPQLDIEVVGRPILVAREGEVDQATLEEWGSSIVVFPPGKPPSDLVKDVRKGLEQARQALSAGDYDLVVLDEVNVTTHYQLAKVEEVIEIISCRKPEVEVVATGRYAAQELIDQADLVTEMVDIKHYYSQGISARKGIEF